MIVRKLRRGRAFLVSIFDCSLNAVVERVLGPSKEEQRLRSIAATASHSICTCLFQSLSHTSFFVFICQKRIGSRHLLFDPNSRHPHSGPHTHARNPDALAGPSELVEQSRDLAGTGATKGMSKGNGATIGVYLRMAALEGVPRTSNSRKRKVGPSSTRTSLTFSWSNPNSFTHHKH